MMKSAIDWLMGKSDSLSLNNSLNPVPANIGNELEASSSDKDTSKDYSILNGHFSGTNSNRTSPVGMLRRPSTGEEVKSPWGRTLTPKSSKYGSHLGSKFSRTNSPLETPLRMTSPVSWEDMSFASDVMSPGFTSRIAKESKTSRKPYDGSRKYPIGQEKFIRSGVIPNVRLKGRSKPVVMARRAPSSPLLPLASSSSSSPFSSTSLTSGFLASATTRMPDISSVVSVLDSTPTTSACESIKDPTSVQAVVAALEQAQNFKSGIKRSRYGESEDSNKKQKCVVNSTSVEDTNEFSSPLMTQAFNNRGGGEKRALDLSPPSSTGNSPSDRPQISPENKRRCVPDPRIASFSSSKNISNSAHNPLLQNSGRDTPFSIYESQQDSDSESNKSLESHQSRQSERSFRGQNHDPPSGRVSNQEQSDHSGSQTPQSVRGSYGLGGGSNGSGSSSRTTTPSKPSHVFCLDAYKADKAKSHQRLNKMLGMLFNVADEDIEARNRPNGNVGPNVANNLTTSDSKLSTPNNLITPITTTSSGTAVTTESTSTTSSSSFSLLSPSLSSAPVTSLASTVSATELFKEAFSKVQPESPSAEENKKEEKEKPDAGGNNEVSSSFTLTLKSFKQNEPSVSKSSSGSNAEVLCSNKSNEPNNAQSIASHLKNPSNKEESVNSGNISAALSELQKSPTLPVSSSSFSSTAVSNSSFSSTPVSSSSFASALSILGKPEFKEPATSKESVVISSPLSFSFFGGSSTSTTSTTTPTTTLALSSQNSSKDTLNTSNMPAKQPSFSFGFSQSSATSPSDVSSTSTFTFCKPIGTVPEVSSASSGNIFNASSKPAEESEKKITNKFSFGSSSESHQNTTITTNTDPATSTFALPAIEGNNFKPSFGITQPSTQTTTKSSAGLFSFGVSTTPTVVSKDKETTVNAPSQSLSSPFTFGASLPSSTTTEAAFPKDSKIPSSIFTFGSIAKTTSSNVSMTSAEVSALPSETQPKLPAPPSLGFTFSPSQSSGSSTTTTSAPVFNNVFSFGSNLNKPTVTNPSQSTLQTTTVSSTSTTASGLFTFGDATKSAPQANVSPFSFGASSNTPISTPSFAGNMGGGFSFGSMKSNTTTTTAANTTTTSGAVPLFGVTSTAPSSNTFSFNTPNNGKPPTFGFGTPKTNTPTGPASNVFTFGNNTAQASPFNTPSTSSGISGFSSTQTPNVAPNLNFGSKSTAGPTFGSAQSPITFGSQDSNIVKPLFGGNESSTIPKFGSTSAVSPFGGGQSQNPNPFVAKPSIPTFGSFGGGDKIESQTGVSTGVAPNQNPFQMGQSANQNAAFNFGQAASNPQPGVFQFGSPGTGTSGAAPSFGTGNFNFGSGNMGGPSGANLFTLGAASDTPSTGRRPKARAHRRR